MNRAVRLVTVLSLLALAACAGETGSATTTTTPSTTSTSPPPTTTSSLPPIVEEGWLTLGPDGIRSSDGTVLWRTEVFAWHTLARDGLGGFVFVDESGLWWFERGANGPRMVVDVFDDLIEVVDIDGEPAARLGYCDSTYVSLRDGSEITPTHDGRVEIDCGQGGLAVLWTASNGLTAEIVGPEYAIDAEGQPSELAETARLIVSQDGLTLLELDVGGIYESHVRIHDFDGQRIILSRGPFEPAIPDETFFFLDLATGEIEWMGVHSATTAALRGADTGPIEVAEASVFTNFLATPILTDNLIVELEDGRYLGFIDHVSMSGLTEGPEIHFDLAVWFSGREAEYATSADGGESPPPNDYYIRNEDPTVLVRTVAPEVTVTSVWYHYDRDPVLESRDLSFEQLVDALTGEPVGAHLNMWHDPWWFTIVDNEIVAIDEQYVP